MTSPRSTDRRRILAISTRLLVAASVLPMLAPTCGTGGEDWKTFSQRSLIIPMDVCYQSQGDGVRSTYTPTSCTPGPQDRGNVIKAYGLVYQLVRSNIAVYWIIDQNKTSLTGYDLAIQYNGGVPVQKYDWVNRRPGNAPPIPADHVIRYRGGPFVVDGSDYDRALQVLSSFEGTFGTGTEPVNIHISNVAFRGWAKRTMAGGWSAGGTIPPKLALLDIGSGNATAVNTAGRPTSLTNARNAEPVIAGYLERAGIGTGTAGGTATGSHGEIYDRLTIADFQPASGSSDPTTSRLFTNGYEILWVPHWVAPGSCSNFSSNANCVGSLYPQAQIDQTLRTIGRFVADGHDLFAECAGLGSFEGAFKRNVTTTTPSSYAIDYQDGDPSTRFQTTLGVRYNELPTINNPDPQPDVVNSPPAFPAGNFGSPLLQLGDYEFTPFTGAIEDYRFQEGTRYQPDVVRLVTARDPYDAWDYFSIRPRKPGEDRGTIVYLAGHSYSGVQGAFQIAGSRLVLNTLFNLGAACTASGVACDTGKLGVCGRGVIQCVNGQPACVQNVQGSAEVCDGLDNDCNGLVDDMDTSCYDGPPSSINPSTSQPYGLCTRGVRSCELRNGTYAMSACNGQVLPTAEVCNGLDDDCDGQADETLSQACYTGPSNSLGEDGLPRGVCKAGRQLCTNGSWSACTVCAPGVLPGTPAYEDCQVLPGVETCEANSARDENCDGQVNEVSTCNNCASGTTLVCYTGPSGTVNVGTCTAGTQLCRSDGTWAPCVGQVTPSIEVCSPATCVENPTDPACNKDENCNNQVDEGCGCSPGATLSCYSGPSGTQGVGTCTPGVRKCDAGVFAPACLGEIQPNPETCDGLDNDCDNVVDDGASCNNGFYCEHGVCVPDHCGAEAFCPFGYRCDDTTRRCVRGFCPEGSATVCGDGEMCEFGVSCRAACPDPASESICWAGAYCQGTGQSGQCVGGGCYFTGCPTGQLCQQGACRPDPCAGVTCPAGTFCRQGDCVQSCAFVSCSSGRKCGVDGFCETDPCDGKTCDSTTQKCVDGVCVEDTCLGKYCGAGQVCEDQVCVDDPCTGVVCPVGYCVGGQCFPLDTPDSHNPTQPTDGGGGGGCGQGSPGALSLLLLVALLPLVRRRRAPAAARLLPLLALATLLGSACGGSGGGGGGGFDPALCIDPNYPACEGETHCVSIWTDAAHCGACGAACGDGEICVNKNCGPSSAVAPHIASLSPGDGPQGLTTPVLVTINGERFVEGATLRSASDRGTRTIATEYVNASQLRAQLDLSSSTPDVLYLRVVNPNRVISNALPFVVNTPTPVITSLDPASVDTGTQRTITVKGTGFLLSSQCRLRGAGFSADLTLPTTRSGADLLCVVDASVLVPADYQLLVVTPADPDPIPSLPRTLHVNTLTPVVTDVSPNQGESGSVIAITVGGSGFDPTSVVLWDDAPVGTMYLDSTLLYVAQKELPGTAGSHTIKVRNGSAAPYVTSGSMPFTVGSAPPTLSTLSPASAYQGDAGITLRVNGTGFSSPALIQLAPPGGAWRAALATSVTATQVSTTSTVSFDGEPAGDWLVRLCYASPCTASSPTSPTLPFRVLSSQAILQSASPRSAAQGTSTVVSMTVSNLRPPTTGVRVKFSGSATPITPSLVSGTTVQATIVTTNLPTGTYTLQVTNPNNAADSNALSFNVTPGLPTISTVSPTSAPIQEAPILITLNGSNFARPDLGGNGGSSVHVSSPELQITDWAIQAFRDCGVAHPLPWACVTSATQIEVHLDTRAAVPSPTSPSSGYDVQVWNPGGPTPPQKSNLLNDAFRITG